MTWTATPFPYVLLLLLMSGLAAALRPREAVRRVVWVVVHVLYRLEVRGLERLVRFAKSGPGVVVANHVSYTDALIIGALAPRPMRFVMDHRIFRLPLIGPFFRFARAIPIASARDDAATKEAAFESIRQALVAGETVCIFPEGRLTRNGEVLSFRSGIERILQEHPTKVLPVGLSGLWGSWLSYAHGKPAASLPKRFRAPVIVDVGDPICAQTKVDACILESRVLARLHDGNDTSTVSSKVHRR